MTTRPLTRARAAANTAPHAADWYRLHLDAETDTATLDLFTEIGFWGTPAADFVQVLDGITAGRILVRVNSPGGDLWDSVAIYNALRDHPAAVDVTVYGLAASGASLIAMAGETITMKRGSRMMIHDAWGGVIGNPADVAEYAAFLDQVSDDAATIYAARAGGTADQWRERMRAETWYNAAEAVAAGLATTTDDTDTDTEDAADTVAAPAENSTTHRPAASITTERTHTTMPDLADLRADLDDLRRDLAAAMSSNHHTAAPSPLAAFSSLGDYVAGWAGSRHTEAADAYDHLVKALITTDDAVMIPSWLGVIQADMKARQPILDLFTHTQDLPATGLSVSYGILTDETTEPGTQAAQGAELVNMGKVSLDAASSPVQTVGGWTDYSLQWVQRASVETLDVLWKALAMRYGQALERRARARLDAVYTERAADPTVTAAKPLAGLTALDWRGLLIDLVEATDESLWPITGCIASPAVFRALATLPEQKAALQIVGNPDGHEGTLGISTLDGKLDGFTVRMRPGWAGTKFAAIYKGAIRVQESPGAPLRLTNEPDAKTLTQTVSLYGYVADYAPIPQSIHVVEFGA